MIIRSVACKKAGFAAKGSIARSKTGTRGLVTSSSPKNATTRENEKAVSQSGDRSPGSRFCPYTSLAEAKKQKRDQDRDFLISVLESTATKRDAKTYLQTFGPAVAQEKPGTSGSSQDVIGAVPDRPKSVQGEKGAHDRIPHVAVVKIRRPQDWSNAILAGVTRTLAQLNSLGMPSVIVVECDLDSRGSLSFLDMRQIIERQMNRISAAIDGYDGTPTKVLSFLIAKTSGSDCNSSAPSSSLVVHGDEAIISSLRAGQLLIIPSLAINEEDTEEAVDANGVVFTLVKFLSGFQPNELSSDCGSVASPETQSSRKAWVDRVIIIDPVGGIPSRNKGHRANVFVNLEDEFEVIQYNLARQSRRFEDAASSLIPAGRGDAEIQAEKHLENLRLAKSALSILPATSSAVITSHTEAANIDGKGGTDQANLTTLTGQVGTRRKQNPLIHNLLTDRPVYSSSLPIGRIKGAKQEPAVLETKMPTTTLVKKGLPVTIFPDPRVTPWVPPRPGTPHLRLTDTCIDLPRLVHLIDDSFGRKLDIKHYLQRVNDSLAGIIIAGEYEGGAILTWEKPHAIDRETAYETGRLVPYLDKFAVLKKSQGAGGVADIIFNAMVRECFPDGVCWRSRKNNPVNKWYFERSKGTQRLVNSNWAMFWTSPNVISGSHTLEDYEDVCRDVLPSWKDNKPVAD